MLSRTGLAAFCTEHQTFLTYKSYESLKIQRFSYQLFLCIARKIRKTYLYYLLPQMLLYVLKPTCIFAISFLENCCFEPTLCVQRQLISFQVICAIKVGRFYFCRKASALSSHTEVIKWKGWGKYVYRCFTTP